MEASEQRDRIEEADCSGPNNVIPTNPMKAAFHRRAAGFDPFPQEKDLHISDNKNVEVGDRSCKAGASSANPMKAAFHRRAAGFDPFSRPEGHSEYRKSGVEEARSSNRPNAGAVNPMKAAYHRHQRERNLKGLLSHAAPRQPSPSRVNRRALGRNPFIVRERSRRIANDVELWISLHLGRFTLLFSEYFDAKFGGIEGKVLQSASIIRSLRYEVCQWRIDRIAKSLSLLDSELYEEFIGPRFSSRRKVDQHLHHNDLVEGVYRELKNTTSQASFILRSIRYTIRDLAWTAEVQPERRRYYVELGRLLTIDHINLTKATHGFRAAVIERMHFNGPFADLWRPKALLSMSVFKSTGESCTREVIDTFIHVSQTGDKPENHPKVFPAYYRQILWDFYIPMLSNGQISRDDTSDMHLQQLDVMAPFDLALQYSLTLVHETQYLITSLDEKSGLWSGLDLFTRQYHRFVFKHINQAFRMHHSSLTSFYKDLMSINWARLQIQQKLCAMGELDSNEKNRSFTALNPISKDIQRFYQWVDRMNLEWWRQIILSCASHILLDNSSKTTRAADSDWETYNEYMRHSNAVTLSFAGRPLGNFGPYVTYARPVERIAGHVPSRPMLGTRSYATRSNAFPAGENVENGEGGLSGTQDMHQSTCSNNQAQPTMTNEAEMKQQIQAHLGLPANALPPKFWSHRMHKDPDGKDIAVHYCRSLQTTEKVARYFLDEQVMGFDMEWKVQATSSDTIQNNLSLIQIASEKRIALFHIALFKPATDLNHLVAPSLRHIMESPDIMKVGVSIKADCTRLRKYLGVNARAIFELSHLHRLVKYCQTSPKLVNKRLVTLNQQVEEHFGMPLLKESCVRCGDWTRPLNYDQVQYAATDPYACIRLFNTMDGKRKELVPVPPRPAHAELDLPIRLVEGEVSVNKKRRVVSHTEAILEPAVDDGKST